MMQLIDIFAAANYNITFASTAQNLEFSEDLTRIGISIKNIELNSIRKSKNKGELRKKYKIKAKHINR